MNSPITIHLLGDVMLGRLVNERLRDQPPEYVWGDTLPVLRQADCRICNLESVISDRGGRWSKTPKIYHFRSDSEHVSALKAGGINAVSLANNHTLDFDYEGMFDMLRILDAAGIQHAGAGANQVAAAEPAIFRACGKRIGLLSFTDNQPEWAAGPEQPGIFFVPADVRNDQASLLFELVRFTRQRVDFLIVAPHWGSNWGSTPPLEHVEFAHELIKRGADVVFGHSPHVFRGVEIRGSKPIIYSAGNFIDDYVVDADERNDWSFIFTLEVEDAKVRNLILTPTIIELCHAQLATGADAVAINHKMIGLCEALKTSVIHSPNQRSLKITIPNESSPLHFRASSEPTNHCAEAAPAAATRLTVEKCLVNV